MLVFLLGQFYNEQVKKYPYQDRYEVLYKEIKMATIEILLVCGSGASSGFMAANMRKAATKKGLDFSIKARSESEIENYIDEIDVLMVGPHLAYILDEVEEYTHGTDVKVLLMRSDYYATLDGSAAIEHLIAEMK